LQATALVHEAWLRLVGDGELEAFDTRGHFYTAAAEAMRRILIDHARAKGSDKRGGKASRLPLDVVDLAQSGDLDQTLALDDAVSRLEELDPEAGHVVRLRFYAGLEVDETARVLGLSPRTTARDWAFARAWLFQQLSGAN
jgi:RNA polymerase sigma factor (TIGR02999 family)